MNTLKLNFKYLIVALFVFSWNHPSFSMFRIIDRDAAHRRETPDQYRERKNRQDEEKSQRSIDRAAKGIPTETPAEYKARRYRMEREAAGLRKETPEEYKARHTANQEAWEELCAEREEKRLERQTAREERKSARKERIEEREATLKEEGRRAGFPSSLTSRQIKERLEEKRQGEVLEERQRECRGLGLSDYGNSGELKGRADKEVQRLVHGLKTLGEGQRKEKAMNVERRLEKYADDQGVSPKDARQRFAIEYDPDASIPGPCGVGSVTKVFMGYRYPQEWEG